MANFDLYTDDMLRAELDRRERLKQLRNPMPLQEPDMTEVIKLVHGYVDELASSRHRQDDIQYYVFEAAVTAVYGPGVWTWINARQR